jgi:hypothetical protein
VRYSVEPEIQGEVAYKVYAPEGANVVAELSKLGAYESATLDGERVELKATGEAGALAMHFGKKLARETQPAFSAPTIRRAADGTTTVAITVQVPADLREARASLLFESAVPVAEVKTDARDNSTPVSVAEMKSPQGSWHWFTVNLAPGSHALECQLRHPAAAVKGTLISGWLRSKRGLVTKEVRLKLQPGEKLAAPPQNLLPTSTGVEKLTYTLFDERPL